MPDCFGKLAVTTLVCFLFSHTRLRVGKTPGIPCALFSFGGFRSTTRAWLRRGNAEVRQVLNDRNAFAIYTLHCHSGARAKRASPESIPPSMHGLLRLSSRKQQIRNAISWSDERCGSPRPRTQRQGCRRLHQTIFNRQTGLVRNL